MPELRCAGGHWPVENDENLLDALLRVGIAVPHGCRAGSCQSCQVHCTDGMPRDLQPALLSPERYREGWRLACQCRIAGDLTVEAPGARGEDLGAEVCAVDWLGGEVLRLRLTPRRPLRYQAGQHLPLRSPSGVIRPYSLASLPDEDPWLEFHLDCRGAGPFREAARALVPGAAVVLAGRPSGALCYDPDWAGRPLLLLAGGTGLGPLWGILREALRQGHRAPIHVLHQAGPGGHYLAGPLADLAARQPNLSVELCQAQDASRLPSSVRQSLALVCGRPAFVADWGRRLFLAGVPRRQVLCETFGQQEEG